MLCVCDGVALPLLRLEADRQNKRHFCTSASAAHALWLLLRPARRGRPAGAPRSQAEQGGNISEGERDGRRL